jgi:hypothetical protein
MGFGVFHPHQTQFPRVNAPNEYTCRRVGRALPSFFHSGDVLRVIMRPMTVQGWADAQENSKP